MNVFALLSTSEPSSASVVLTSLTLVFLLLILLACIITLEGKIFDAINNKKRMPKAPAAPAAAAPAAQASAAPAPAVQKGISGEIIAVISAAVAFVTGGKGSIRSVRRAGSAKTSRRGAWGNAGVNDTTRPFM
jgi:sodium pump decarboxylase gamma subunit